MSANWKNNARHSKQLIDTNNVTSAHLYMEQLILFPIDIQDQIIEDISQLPYCSSDAIATILGYYSMQQLK